MIDYANRKRLNYEKVPAKDKHTELEKHREVVSF